VAVIVGEAAVRIRADADPNQIKDDSAGPILDALGEVGGKGAALLGGLLGGAALSSSFLSAMENEALGDKLNAQLGASGQYAEDLGAIAGELYAGAYGENLGEVNEALRSVIQSGAVMEDATNEQLKSITASAMDLATAFDQDVAGTARAAGRMVQTGLADTAEEAFDILTRGFQQGADAGGDFLDVIGEYGTTFDELGLNGAQSVGLLNQALAAGIPNADFAADALREIGIIAREGGEEAAEALGDLGINADNYFAKMQAGGPGATAALDNVLDALRNTEDPALRASAAAALVGTQYEDLGDAILQLDPSEATASLGEIEGAAGRMGDTLNDNASARLTSFWRTAQGVFVDFLGGTALPIIDDVSTFLTDTFGPALEGVGAWLNETVKPALTAVGDYLSATFGPALDAIRAYIEDDVMPALESFSDWMEEHEGTIQTIAGVITALLIPALLRLGVQALVSGAMTVAGWAMSAAGAVATGVVYVVQSAIMIARFIAISAAALLSAGLTVGAWIGMGIAAVVNAAVVAAAWLGAQLSTLASLAAMALGFIVQGAIMVGSMAATAAGVVASWVVMATQSLIQAARMAAAWFIALGPIGWVILAIGAVVALIIANWETVKNFTVEAWNTISEKVSGAWNAVVGAISTGIATAVSFVSGLPGRIVGAIGDFGSLLYNKGRDLITGLINGIASAASFVGGVAKNIVNSVIGFVNSNIIDGINGLLEFTVAGIRINPPDIPRIPKLHSGGRFDSGVAAGEGFALLRDRELVVTPEQEETANQLLASLLSGNMPAGRGAGGVSVTNNITQAPGESPAALAARVTQGVVWNLNGGITRPVGVTS
jgi:hypothetical protein